MPGAADQPVLLDPLPIEPLQGPFDATIRPPGSKSLTNRALLLAALASGPSTLHHPLIDADDAQQMIRALTQLGATITQPTPHSLVVQGVAGRWRPDDTDPILHLNNAGTATRFLTAAALLSPTPITIDGNDRMRSRPIGELTDALAHLGARIEHRQAPACPPIRITPPPPDAAPVDRVHFGATRSSQFISALLLVAPWLPQGLTIELTAPPTSASYIRMTLDLLSRIGASVRTSADLRVLRVGPPPSSLGLDAFELTIEPDLSGATYFWAAAAMSPGATSRISGLAERPLQGDVGFVELLARMGADIDWSSDERSTTITLACRGTDRLDPILADLADMPDAAVTLAVVAAFASGVSVLRGVRTLRDKECDRIAALTAELAKVGVLVESDIAGDPNTMTITPPAEGIDCSPAAPPIVFETYQDHRMAMALSLIGLRRPGVSIADPACVGKTYPGFWDDLASLTPAI